MPLKCTAKQGDELILYVNGTEALTIKDVTEFSSFFDGHLNGPDQFKTFFDLRKVTSANMETISAMAKYMTSFEQLAKEKVLGNAILIDGFLLENLLKLLFTMKPPTTPTKITSKLEEACEYLNSL